MRRKITTERLFRGRIAGARHYTVPVQEPVKQKLSIRQRLALVLIPPLAALLIRLLGLTLRYVDLAEPGVTPGYAIPGPTVFAF